MSVRFSLIYPTRHRPAFIKQALRFLEEQDYRDFEVIISDNYTDPSLSCENECRSSAVQHLKYVHPSKPVGMVGNWNYPLQFASGDYICYFTDKMFLLPHTLASVSDCIDTIHPEIINWVDNSYTPNTFPDYFGAGIYDKSVSSVPAGSDFITYDPLEALSIKGRAQIARYEQDKSTYVRGKLCFGAYSAELCRQIIDRTGALFHDVSPDYSSMILALSAAKSAVEIKYPGIVHVNTDLSNGGQVALRDDFALKFLNDLGHVDEILENLLVPGLYASSHNIVSYDYLTLKKKFELSFEFDPVNWLVYITEDLDVQGRQWSSKEVETQQRELLRGFINGLSQIDQIKYKKKLRERIRLKKNKSSMQSIQSMGSAIIKLIKVILPGFVITMLKGWLRKPKTNNYSSIEDVLN